MKARITLLAAMMTIVLSAAAMPFTEARNKAMFLSDKIRGSRHAGLYLEDPQP